MYVCSDVAVRCCNRERDNCHHCCRCRLGTLSESSSHWPGLNEDLGQSAPQLLYKLYKVVTTARARAWPRDLMAASTPKYSYIHLHSMLTEIGRLECAPTRFVAQIVSK